MKPTAYQSYTIRHPINFGVWGETLATLQMKQEFRDRIVVPAYLNIKQYVYLNIKQNII